MQRALAADQFKQKSREAKHRQPPIPDLGAVVPAPDPLLLGVELDLGGELGSLIEVDLRSSEGGFDQIGQAFDEGGVGIEGRDPAEILNSSFRRDLPVLDVDFLEGFDVLAHETDRDHHQFLDALATKADQGFVGIGLEPLHRTDPALISEGVGIVMAELTLQLGHHQGGRGFDVLLVGIARFLHIALGNAMGTEKDMGRRGVVAGPQFGGGQFGQGLHITGVVVPGADAADRQPIEFRVGLAEALQLPEAGAAGADREVGIEGSTTTSSTASALRSATADSVNGCQ